MRVTASVIEGLKPKAARYERADPAVPGLQIRVEPTGSKHWQLRYYWQGKRQKLALGTWPRGRDPGMGLEQARSAAINARELLDAGIDPRRAERSKRTGVPGARRRLRPEPPVPLPGAATLEAPAAVLPAASPKSPVETALELPALAAALRDRHSVAKLVQEYVIGHVRKQRRRPEYVERFLAKDVLPEWGTRDARTIKPREVIELLDGIVERGSGAMANRGAGMLSQMFRYGVHRAIVETSPVQLLYRPGGKEKPRERNLNDDELAFLLRFLESGRLLEPGVGLKSQRQAHSLMILLLTGQRRSELAFATWRNVKLNGNEPTWYIPAEHSKTGEPHTLPLTQAAVREFESLKKYATGSLYVLPTADGKAPADPKIITRSVSRNLKRMQTDARECDPPVKLAPFTPHDLRRTCRTGLSRLRVSNEIAERILNHKLPEMRGVYDKHLPLAEMRDALEKWAAHLVDLAANHGIKGKAH